MDLSFQLGLKQKLFESVNSKTREQAKLESVVQIGIAPWRLIAIMTDHEDLDLPLIFYNIDIKYGLWFMSVNNEDTWNLCYVLLLLTHVNSIDEI